ncbi:thioredoxin family protein [Afifella pfennigii]|uniref:thioredoxin family protein n=1 Tax=Afifella pfennigii TaxID=209897 RepID=UPI0004788CFA|nr:thioredoxin family protein [Afifella pfennigii]
MSSNTRYQDRRQPAKEKRRAPSLPKDVAAPSGGLSRRALVLGGALAVAALAAPPIGSALAAPPLTVSDVESYRQALASLARQHRYALIDIRAEWCAVCHRIEREVLAHPSVERLLQRVPLVKVDVTAMDDGNRRLLSYLRADGPPTFFVVETASGAEYARTRSVGSFRRRDLVRRLRPFAQAG